MSIFSILTFNVQILVVKFNGVVSVDAFALTIGKSSCEFFIAVDYVCEV